MNNGERSPSRGSAINGFCILPVDANPAALGAMLDGVEGGQGGLNCSLLVSA